MELENMTPRQIVNELDYLDKRLDQIVNTIPFPAEMYSKVKLMFEHLKLDLFMDECLDTSVTLSVIDIWLSGFSGPPWDWLDGK